MRQMLLRVSFLCVVCLHALLGAEAEIQSPRLAALTSTPSPAQLEQFWSDVSTQGTPLIEAAPADASHALVTFLWRGEPNTRNVAIFATITSRPIEVMERIGTTDVWYVATRVPVGARFAYRIAVNSPMVTDGPRVGEQLRALQADPLNHKPWACSDLGGHPKPAIDGHRKTGN